jgi:hypothetical protein
MESQLLATTSVPRSTPSEPQSKNVLIREWITKLALNAGAALDAQGLAVYTAIWEEGFSDLPDNVLEAAFRKTLRTCKFWPVKVADVREHIDRTKETALAEAADLEWQRVLDLRRVYWNPDMAGGFSRGMPKLSERVASAARAAGVFREVSDPEQLHVWGKKRFIESYLAWDALEQDQYLLPDGELKNLLAGCTETKALPAPQVPFNDLHERGLRYAEQIKEAAPLLAVNRAVAARYSIWNSEEERRQAILSLQEKETSPDLLENARRQKVTLEARGFAITR